MNKGFKFTDILKFDAVSIPEQIKQQYLQITDSEQEIKPLHIKLIATHAARITGNNTIYLPSKMKDAVPSWTKHYNRPILCNHDVYSDPIGRVESAEYVDITHKYQDFLTKKDFQADDTILGTYISGEMSFKDAIDYTVKHFVEELPIINDPNFEGLGYIILNAKISDPEAIKKILDGRYVTGSISATSSSATCSICKQDWGSDAGPCEHVPGKLYKNKKMVLVAGDLKYNEYSFVNKPADSMTNIIEYFHDGISEQIKMGNMEDSMQNKKEEVKDQNINPEVKDLVKEFWGEKYNEIVGDDAWGKDYADMMAVEELRDKALTAQQRKNLSASTFCGPDRSFPVPDCAHVTAARRLIERYEGSGSKEKILACVERKAKRMGCDKKDSQSDDFGSYTPESFDNHSDEELKQMLNGLKKTLEERGMICSDCDEINKKFKDLESQVETTKKELSDAQTELQTAYANVSTLSEKEKKLESALFDATKEHLFFIKNIKNPELTKELFDKETEGKSLTDIQEMFKVPETTVDSENKESTISDGPQPEKELEQIEDPTLKLDDAIKTENKVDKDQAYKSIVKQYSNLKKISPFKAERFLKENLAKLNK